MQKTIYTLLLLGLTIGVYGQRYYTKNAVIKFRSESNLEKVEAINTRGTFVLDCQSGQLEMALLLKAFQFEKALMQEHFNENYVESEKYPKSTFKGRITNIQDIKFGVDGKYKAKIDGKLNLHGVTKPIQTVATFSVNKENLTARCNFALLCSDYNIKIPSLVKDNISNEIEIAVISDLKAL